MSATVRHNFVMIELDPEFYNSDDSFGEDVDYKANKNDFIYDGNFFM